MIKPHYKEFIEAFNIGFISYINGNWKKAKEDLELVELVKKSHDYPSRCLLSYMKENDYIAPANWKGFRVLTEK
jgi:hypothetical protein